MNQPERLARTALLLAAFAAGALRLPVPLLAPLGLAGIAATAELAARAPGRAGVDRLLVALGYTICAAVLGGLALALSPPGLTAPSWAGYWLVLGLATLLWKARRPVPATAPEVAPDPVADRSAADRPAPARTTGAGMSLYVLACTALLGAVGLAALGATGAGTEPLALWLVSRNATSATVAVHTGADTGPVRLAVVDTGTGTVAWAGDPFTVAAGAPARELTVPLPGAGRWRVQLNGTGGGPPIRELVLDLPTGYGLGPAPGSRATVGR